MLQRFRDAGPEARLRLIVAFCLIGIVSVWGYMERNPQTSGAAAPMRILTSSEKAADCGRLSLMGSGNTCGGTLHGITFTSAAKR